MKTTLIVLGVICAQLAIPIFIAKLIRAGRGPLAADYPQEDYSQEAVDSHEAGGRPPLPSPARRRQSAESTSGLAALALEIARHDSPTATTPERSSAAS